MGFKTGIPVSVHTLHSIHVKFLQLCTLLGSVPAMFLMESIIEHIAKVLNKDPADVKTLNLFNQGDVSIIL